MTDLVRLYAQIALLRRGPQDVPASMLLLVITVSAYFCVNALVTLLLPALGEPWFLMLAVDVLFTLTWYSVLLHLLRKPERFLQTATAVFGFRAVMSPFLIVSAWLLRRLISEDAVWQFPLAMLYVAIVVWMIAANSQILKVALEWSAGACIALVILETLVALVLQFSLFSVTH
jgi:hypothetical protein